MQCIAGVHYVHVEQNGCLVDGHVNVRRQKRYKGGFEEMWGAGGDG